MNGSHLLSIVDPFEQAFIKYIVKQYGKSDIYWIGLKSSISSTNLSQTFEWTDDWPVYQTYWNVGEPQFPELGTDLFNQECVYMYRANSTWKTAICDLNIAYICKTTTNPLPVADGDRSGVCPQVKGATDTTLLWQDLDKRSKHCYWFSVDVKTSGVMSWSDAAFHCRTRNGTLASIHSNHEILLMKMKLKKTEYDYNTWIGLSKNYLGNFI